MNKIKIFSIIIFLSLFLISCGNNKEVISENNNVVNKTEEKIILSLWDSLTAWYNLDISKSYPSQLEKKLQDKKYSYKIINAWVSWDTSEWLLNRIWLYDDIKPYIYLLNIWSNDWLRRLDVNNMKNNIREIINHLKKLNKDTKIVLFWMKLPINYWVEYSNNFAKIFKDLADENKLYFYEFFLEWVARDIKLNLNDWIHPNEKGYNIISNNILNYLEEEKILEK